VSGGILYWQVTSLEAIAAWLSEDGQNVEHALVKQPRPLDLMKLIVNTKSKDLVTILPPFQKIFVIAERLVRDMTQGSLMLKLLTEVKSHPEVSVRLNILKMLLSIVKHGHQKLDMLRELYGLDDVLQHLAEKDSAVLVREIASKIMLDIVQSTETEHIDAAY
jgi:hypothetical protein